MDEESPLATGSISILLVDDDVQNLDILESTLVSPELRLVRAQTPDEALLALVHDEFACIVMDIQMPGMNGVELARLIKTRKRNQRIPIIFLTAFFLEEKDVLQGYSVGAVDYLTKPLNPAILKSKVGVFTDLFRTTHALANANSSLELEIVQRQKAEENLRQANLRLEARVQDRAADLVRVNGELRQGEDRYRQLVRGLPAAVYTTDAEGRITLYNTAAAAVWGREPEIGRDFWCGACKIFNPDGTDLPLDECPMARTLKEGHAIRGEEIIIERPDGTRRHILPYPEPLYDVSGKLAGAVNMLVDITEQKQAERALRQLAAIVESSEDAIISKTLTGVVTTWNESAQRLFGYSAEDIVGRSITILHPHERQDEEAGILERIRNSQPVNHYETVRRRKDGSLVEVSLTISPIKNADGEVIGASKIARDISKRKQTERELTRAHDELVAASRAKDNFLATLSHELRTPLNPILLIASDGAHNSALSAEVRANFEMIRKNVELEARLIDDLLDLTGITQGKLILEKSILDAHSVLQDAIATVQGEITQKQIELQLEFKANNHAVFADGVRLQQIFWNLLRNAAKFTPRKGRILVETRTLADERKFVATVTDTGIGMSADEISRIFDIFSQGNHANATGHRYGGLGLGLAISQKLAEFHAGQIRASSDGSDKGSTFIVELPLAGANLKQGNSQQVDPAMNLPAVPSKTISFRILLVEDHEPTRTALSHLLTRRSHDVVTAASIAEARSLADSRDFNLLISDIGLPDGSGYDLMMELQKRGSLKGIALTGYGMEQDRVRSQNAGFVAHLTKPVRVQSLEAALNAVAALVG